MRPQEFVLRTDYTRQRRSSTEAPRDYDTQMLLEESVFIIKLVGTQEGDCPGCYRSNTEALQDCKVRYDCKGDSHLHVPK